MSSLLQRRIVQPLRQMLLGGITPRQLALSMAIGAVIGIFPVLGTTTALCALAAIILRLNLPAIQLVNYLMYPIQLALLLPLIRAGQWILRSKRTTMTLQQIVATAKSSPGVAFHQLWRLLLAGMVAWAVFAAVITPLLFYVFRAVVAGIQRGMEMRRTETGKL